MKKIITLLFILTSSISFSQDSLECPNVQSGFFGYKGELKSTFILRTKDGQIEYNLNDDSWVILKLDWVSNCECNFEFFKISREEYKSLIGIKCKAVITFYDDEKYNYNTITLDNSFPPTDGELYFQDNVPKKIKKKMKKLLRKNS